MKFLREILAGLSGNIPGSPAAERKPESLDGICRGIESAPGISSSQLFADFGLLSGHPWEATVNSDITNYYSCLHQVVAREEPVKVLEIGTAFGLSAATLLRAMKRIDLFVSLDLGIYGYQYGFGQSNTDFARDRIHAWCARNRIPLNRVRFSCVNTQPDAPGDNDDAGSEVPRWHEIPELVRLLTGHRFDVVFIDGKHTGDGLYHDFTTFWPMVREGGLVICDDLHDEATYGGIFPWAGQTVTSYQRFLREHASEIQDHYVWNHPRVIPDDFTGRRPFGLVRKREGPATTSRSRGFEPFDTPEALMINRARQDHLASLGLDLAERTVLEVGCGVGWHTGFFESLGCRVLSTDARPENVEEHLRRYPHRRGRVVIADLSVPGSHAGVGTFDVVYCYGTLYHLSQPDLCLRELAGNCSGLFLLESLVHPEDNHGINPVVEDPRGKNNSVEGIGCRPGRDWIRDELKTLYPHVYLTKSQPENPEFPVQWPVQKELPGNCRSVFVASRTAIRCPFALSEELLMQQWRLTDLLA